jgi:hypothetical protein
MLSERKVARLALLYFFLILHAAFVLAAPVAHAHYARL